MGVNRHTDRGDAVSFSRFLRGFGQNPTPKGLTENKQPGKALGWIKGSAQDRKPVRSKYSSGEVAEVLQRSAVGPALFTITVGNLTKRASREVTKFPNDMKLGRSARVRASCEG